MNKQLSEFVRYVMMNTIGMIGLSCYLLADTFFVSKGLGANGLAALNLAIPIYSMVHGCGLMIGMGGATKYSIFRGQKAKKNAEQIFANALYFAGALAIIFCLIGIFFSQKLTGVLGANQEIFEMTETYLRVILLFAPAFMLNDIMICFVRNDGNPKLSMTAMLAGSFGNILLDYIFIFPMSMGIFGAVFATGLAPVISLCVLSKHFWTKRNQFSYVPTVVDTKQLLSIIQLGFPSLITEVASGIVIIVFNMIILGISGNVGVAAYGVIANLSLVVTAICTGIAQGMQPLTSRAYGRGEHAGVKQIFRYAVVTLLIFSSVIYLFVFGMAEQITAVFNSERNEQMSQIAAEGLRLYFLATPFMGYNVIAAMLFTTTERALSAQVIALLRGICLIVPLAFLLSHIAGIIGVWLTFPVTEGIVAIVAVCLYFKRQDKTGR